MNFRHILMVASRWKKAYATVAAPASFGVENSRLWKRAYTAVAAPASIGVENSRLWKREATVPASASVESFSIWKRACTTVADDDGVSVKAKEASTEKRKMFMQLRSLSEKGGSVHETIRKFMSCEEKKLFHLTKSDLRRWAKLFEKYGHHKQALEILDLLNNSTKVVACPNSLIPCNHNTSECLGTHSLAHAASIASPSVVSLLIPGQFERTGFCIDSLGTIVTYSDGLITSSKVRVITKYGISVMGDTEFCIVGKGIAIVRVIGGTPDFSMPPHLELGNSKDLHVGQLIICVGNHGGYNNTLTHGIVSHLERTRIYELGIKGESKVFQIDCPLSKGSLGAPIIDLQGKIVGLVSRVIMKAEGIGFALPVDAILDFMNENYYHDGKGYVLKENNLKNLKKKKKNKKKKNKKKKNLKKKNLKKKK